MRRWNGWGEEAIHYPLSEHACRYLIGKIGNPSSLQDAPLEDVLSLVPESRLPDHPLVVKDAMDRCRHARGQSLPDWLAMRSGNFGTFPDGVAYPEGEEDVRELLSYSSRAGAVVITYGGGTSVVGHITPRRSDQPILTLDMGRMNRLLSLDRLSRIAIFGAGAAGPDVESQLRARGYTLGHFPQSFEYSTVGGWIATRSVGQQSLRYGRIEQLFAGGDLETPVGTWHIPAFPASAAGPDLREVVLGSEGRLGVLTRVEMRVTPLPQQESFHGAFFPDWQKGVDGVRKVVQSGIPLSMMRLSDAGETEGQLAMASHRRLVPWLEKLLRMRGAGESRCMLIFGVTGTKAQCRIARSHVLDCIKAAHGVYIGKVLGRQWIRHRFLAPYLRNSLWEKGYAVDTLETATNWSNVNTMAKAIDSALNGEIAREGERMLLFIHLSHVYPQGASIYATCVFPVATSYDETLLRWRRLKTAASKAIMAGGGTISHQHGVGTDHAACLGNEKGTIGIGAIRALCRHFDPEGMMNPAKLVE